MTDDQVAEVSSTIGNLIRIALAVQPSEARAACDAAVAGSLETFLLDPRLTPESAADDRLNRQLVEAFLHFRTKLELLRQPIQNSKTAEA